ncbi:hypothetical protein SDC9_157347 [bioreactor metagenome]|uniref:Uncharacterized protein n=1 Tax=bioreactor metagenome TaxID=1076179 RepID=A0A645FBX0_9ZZZZ
MVVRRPQRRHGPDDRRVVVGHDPHLSKVDPPGAQDAGEVVHVLVARTSGEDLIADHQDGCGGVGHDTILVIPPYAAPGGGGEDNRQARPSGTRTWSRSGLTSADGPCRTAGAPRGRSPAPGPWRRVRRG